MRGGGDLKEIRLHIGQTEKNVNFDNEKYWQGCRTTGLLIHVNL